MNLLWAIFIAGQIWQAGNINYQQEIGYYELNPIYGKHPSKEKVYMIKAAEICAIYGLTKLFPKHENAILLGATSILVGFILYDDKQGVELKVRF